MAGDEGFEPPNTRTRTWRLTAWPIPTTDLHYILLSLHILVFWSLDQNLYRKYLSGDKFRGRASAPSRFRPCNPQTCGFHLTAWPIPNILQIYIIACWVELIHIVARLTSYGALLGFGASAEYRMVILLNFLECRGLFEPDNLLPERVPQTTKKIN